MLNSFYDYFSKRKILFYSILVVLFAILASLSSRIKFDEDISKLLPSEEKSEKINQVLSTAKFSDKLIINIKGNDFEELKNYTDNLESLLSSNCNDYISKLQTKLNQDNFIDILEFVQANLPLFLNDQDYKYIDSLIQKETIKNKIEESYRSIISPSGLVTSQMIRKDPLGITFLGLKKLQQLQTVDNFTLEDGYIVSKDKKNILVFISTKYSTSEIDKNSVFIKKLDEIITDLNKKYINKSKAEYFGAAAVSVANAKQIKSDIQITMSIAFVFLFSLYFYFYRRFIIPFIVFIPAIFGSLLGISVLYLLKGTISAISIGIGSVLLGITLDYSVHILSHYRSSNDIRKLFKNITKPLLMCAIFTAADFLCLLFLKSDVLKDLGIFTAISVIGAALFSLFFIPQVYKPKSRVEVAQNTIIDKISKYDYSKNKILLIGCFIIVIISLFTYKNVEFNNDLNALNYMPKSLKEAEKNLNDLNNYSSKSIYVISYGDNQEEAFEATHKLFLNLKEKQEDSLILNFSSIGGIVLSKNNQIEKIEKWNNFWTDEKVKKLKTFFIENGKNVGFKENTFSPFYQYLSYQFNIISSEDYKLFNELFLDEFVSTKEGITGITTILKTDTKDTETLINNISKENKNVLVIDRKHLQETILGNLEEDFDNLFLITSIVVFIAVFIYFRSIEISLLTNIPIFIGWFVTLGLMGVFGIQFNAFNIIITTLIFGLGIDYSIFISQALLEKYTYGKTEMHTYKSGIIMSAVTTILCFCVLIFAKHPTIRSIAIIPLIGLLTVVVISFTIQPWLFRILLLNPQKKGYTPFRLLNFIFSLIAFGYFLITALISNILILILYYCLPLKKDKKIQYLHIILRKLFKSLFIFFPIIKIKIEGYSKKLYEKPCIIIANHTSELDTIIMGMLDNRQIFMINERIYNSIFFGKSIRLAGFIPTINDLDKSAEMLKSKIEKGYSVIIFPEGTRSKNSNIQRFHKGAFYLSEKLKLDIQPILIHGNSDVLPKKETLVNNGKINVTYLKKIKYDDLKFGKDYVERSKKILTYFREEFQLFKNKLEKPDYFKKKLFLNYLYKGNAINKSVKKEYEEYRNIYYDISNLIPENAKILNKDSKYGLMDFLLSYLSPRRNIVSYNKDSNKIDIAGNCYSVNRYSVEFVYKLPENIQNFNTIIDLNGINIQEISDNIKWIVSSNNVNISDFGNLGFNVVHENNGILIFNKA